MLDMEMNTVKQELGKGDNRDANNNAVIDINNAAKTFSGYNQSYVAEGLTKVTNMGVTFISRAASSIGTGAAFDIGEIPAGIFASINAFHAAAEAYDISANPEVRSAATDIVRSLNKVITHMAPPSWLPGAHY